MVTVTVGVKLSPQMVPVKLSPQMVPVKLSPQMFPTAFDCTLSGKTM
jgi:hypothetical protein